MNSRHHLPSLHHRSMSAVVAPLIAAVALAGCGKSGTDKKALSAAKTTVGQQVGAANDAMQKAFTPAGIASIKRGAPGRKTAQASLASSAEAAQRALGAAQTAAAKQPSLKALAAKLLAAQASVGTLTVYLRSGKPAPKSLVTGSVGSVESAVNASRDAGVTVKATLAPAG